MKKLILLLFIPLVFSCGNDSKKEQESKFAANRDIRSDAEVYVNGEFSKYFLHRKVSTPKMIVKNSEFELTIDEIKKYYNNKRKFLEEDIQNIKNYVELIAYYVNDAKKYELDSMVNYVNVYRKNILGIEPTNKDAIKRNFTLLLERRKQQISNLEQDTQYYKGAVEASMDGIKLAELYCEVNSEITDIKLYKSLNEKYADLEKAMEAKYNDYSYSRTAFNQWSTAVKENCFKNIIDDEKFNDKKKITLGCFSPDFCEHAVSNQFKKILKLHDKKKFEIIGFYLNSKQDEKLYEMKTYFDKFFDINQMSTEDIIRLTQVHKIDIAIDLAGYTYSNRYQIFNQRCAPLQVSYLGFAGSTGLNNMDYLIADKNV